MTPRRLIVALTTAALVGELLADRPVTAADSFAEQVRSFLGTHCVRCHGADDPRGDLRLDPEGLPTTPEVWREVRQRVLANEMPPAKSPRPPAEDRLRFLEAVSAELGRAAARAGAGQPIVMRRLNRAEYRETLRELLHLHPSLDLAARLPEDDSFRGFDTVGAALNLSPVHLKVYVETAAEAVRLAFPVGPPPNTERLHIEPEEQIPYYQMLDELSALKRELDRQTVPQEERDRRMAAIQQKVARPVTTRIVSFGAVGTKDYLPEGVIYPALAFVEWGKRPEGLYRFRFRLRGVANSAGELPIVTIQLRSNFEILPIRTVELSDEYQVYEGEAYARPHFTRLTFGASGHGNRFYYRGKFTAPRVAVDWVEIEGPITAPGGSKAWREYFAGVPEDEAGAKTVIERLARKAFRRPPTADRVQQFLACYQQRRDHGDDFVTAVKHVLQSILIAPEFLFRVEAAAHPEDSHRPLDGYELATRLSYFLWSGPPDDELFALAETGQLTQSDVLRHQVQRLIQHDRAARFAENFTGQWLHLRQLGQMAPDPKRYPEWDETLEDAARQETIQFFLHVLRTDRPVRALLDADFALLNGRLARFYGIPGVWGSEFRPVPLPAGSFRGGLLGQASLHTLTSDGLRTSPVKRGVFLLENLLGSPPPPPPDDVPPVKETLGATLRERLKAHRELPACAGCHARIDPLGFALENFNAIGKWRSVEEETRLPIDASGELPDGRAFANFPEFRTLLLSRETDLVRCLTEKLLVYALGRPVHAGDETLIQEIMQAAAAEGNTLAALVTAIASSPAFTHR